MTFQPMVEGFALNLTPVRHHGVTHRIYSFTEVQAGTRSHFMAKCRRNLVLRVQDCLNLYQ